ncbi:MAG: monovalent cation/H+ antiporter subunit D family protein [Rhizobiaceae bacterium]
MIEAQLPALQIVLPLIGATLCAVIDRPRVAYVIALVTSALMPLIAVSLLIQVLSDGTISYAMGGWEPPIGIEYRIDVANAFVLVLLSVIAALIMPYAARSVAAEIPHNKQAWFYCMYLLCVSGLLGITITGDAFNAFVFLEISSLSTYVMIAMGKDRRALLAAFQYLVMGTIGATFYVVGVGLLYTMTGTLNFADIAMRIQELDIASSRPVLAALAFITVGLGLKVALFPLHAWLPNAYAGAPSVTTAFLAATATKVAVYLLLRFFYTIFGFELVFELHPVGEVLLVLSIAGMFAASLVAIFQENIKRMLAWSSVAQIGYITLGVSLANMTGLTGSLVHLFNHALIKGGLFFAVGGMALMAGGVKLSDLAGIGRRMPLTMAAFVIAGLSLVGVPGTVGFVSKWYLVLGAFEAGLWWAAFLILITSLMAVVYLGRFVEIAYFREPEGGAAAASDPPLSMLLPTWILVIACVAFGVNAELTAGTAGMAAEVLIEGLR